jgi:hypothetical protein
LSRDIETPDEHNADRQVLLWARQELTHVLSIAPESVQVRLLRAESSLLLGDLGSVKLDATLAVRGAGGNPSGYFYRAQAHHYAMDDALAMDFYRWCVKVDHDHAGCRAGIKAIKKIDNVATVANLYFRTGNFEAALAEYESGLSAAPAHCALVALLHLQKCRCLIYLNESASAVLECRRSFQYDPTLEEAEYLMKNAKQIAKEYMAQEEEKKKAEEEQKKKEEAEKVKEERIKREMMMNATNVSRIYIITEEEKMEARMSAMGLCEQHFWRLNMTNLTHPLPPTDTSTNDVKRAYRKASMVWHPDKHRAAAAKARAERRFQQIVAAYEVLGDEKQLRRCLDGEAPKTEQQQQQEQQQRQPPQPGQAESPDEPPPQGE